MSRRPHFARYGTVSIPRGYCSLCKTYAFIIEGRLQCCDTLAKDEPRGFKQLSEVPIGRKGPNRAAMTSILALQQDRCLYCNRKFGAVVYRKARSFRLRVCWDHISPYCYSLNNHPSNYCAACHVCNSLKSSHIFNSFEAAQGYLYEKWKEKGFSDVPLRIEIRTETPVAKIL